MCFAVSAPNKILCVCVSGVSEGVWGEQREGTCVLLRRSRSGQSHQSSVWTLRLQLLQGELLRRSRAVSTHLQLCACVRVCVYRWCCGDINHFMCSHFVGPASFLGVWRTEYGALSKVTYRESSFAWFTAQNNPSLSETGPRNFLSKWNKDNLCCICICCNFCCPLGKKETWSLSETFPCTG